MNYNDDDSILDDEFIQLAATTEEIRIPPFGKFTPPIFPGGNFPINNLPPNNFPGDNYPSGNFPGSNFPNDENNYGGMNHSNTNIGPPPNYTPSKNDQNVKSFNPSKTGSPTVKAVSPSSISFCLFRFTYIWEIGGRQYWSYLLNVDRVSVSGLRWFRGRWVYFGVDLRRIDSFMCYRNTDCENCHKNNSRTDPSLDYSTKKEYSTHGIKEVYSNILTSVNIHESREDFLVDSLGVIEGNEISTKIPCIKTRSVNYRISLEVTYPDSFEKTIKDKIKYHADEASKEAYKILNTSRDENSIITPIEEYNESVKLINKAFRSISNDLSNKIKNIHASKELSKGISYTIREEKVLGTWNVSTF